MQRTLEAAELDYYKEATHSRSECSESLRGGSEAIQTIAYIFWGVTSTP
ncbi:MAG TPA: hypothetical protein V6D34_17275 [Candidatus Sericytochromatia bacterium]